MIENIRGLVDVVPRLNIFGDNTLARLCEQVKEKIAGVEPASLRPSRTFDPAARARVKRDADALMETVRGVFRVPRRARGRVRAEGGVMAARVHSESARRISDCVTALLREQPFFGSLALRLPIRADATRETVASDGRGDPLFAPVGRRSASPCHRDRHGAGGAWPARSSTTRAGASATRSAGSAPPSW